MNGYVGRFLGADVAKVVLKALRRLQARGSGRLGAVQGRSGTPRSARHGRGGARSSGGGGQGGSRSARGGVARAGSSGLHI